jgi:O-antigen/teichoic acid export membrane protein
MSPSMELIDSRVRVPHEGGTIRQRSAPVATPGQIFRRTAALGGGTAVGGALVVAVSPVLTRLYDVDDFGTYGLLVGLVALFSVIAGLRYESAVLGASSHLEARSLAWVASATSVGVGALAGITAMLLSSFGILGFGAAPRWSSFLVAAMVTLYTVALAYRMVLLRADRFGSASISTSLQGAGRAAGQAGLGLFTSRWWGLLVGDLCGRAVAAARNVWVARRALADLPRPRKADLRAVMAKYGDFARLSAPSALINTATTSAPIFIIAGLFGTVEAGLFALVQRCVAIPAGLLGASLADAMHAELAERASEDPSTIRALLLRVAGTLVLAGLPFAVLAVAWGPELFGVVFGPQWEASGRYAAIIAPWVLVQLTVSPLSRVVFVLSGQRLQLLYDATAFVSFCAIGFVAHGLDWSVELMLGTLSGTATVGYLIYFALLLRLASKSVHAR